MAETLQGRPDGLGNNGGPEDHPLQPIDVLTSAQAEEYVRGIRKARWTDVMPHDAAVAFARMDVADALYLIRPEIHPEYNRRKRLSVNRATELILEARDLVIPRGLPNDLDRPADAWADSMAAQLALRRESKSGDDVRAFRSRKH